MWKREEEKKEYVLNTFKRLKKKPQKIRNYWNVPLRDSLIICWLGFSSLHTLMGYSKNSNVH